MTEIDRLKIENRILKNTLVITISALHGVKQDKAAEIAEQSVRESIEVLYPEYFEVNYDND